MRRGRGRRLAAVIAVVCASVSAPAAAQKTVGDKAAAEALFDHAKRLLAEGRYAEACPKFAESQKLDAGIGTLLYLGECYEKNGQTASAWAAFREAAATAHAAGQGEREQIGRDRAASIEPKLSKLTVVVEPANVLFGVEVTRDGDPIGKVLWGTPIPIDPGRHRIEAVAAGKKPFSKLVDVPPNGAAVSIEVPALVDAPATTTDGASGSTRRVVGLVLVGVGVVGIAAGAAFGVQAIAKNDDAGSFCRPKDPTLCRPEGVELSKQAHSAATLSTIAFAAGGVLVVGGGLLALTAPSSRSSTARSGRFVAAVAAAPGGAGVVVRSAW